MHDTQVDVAADGGTDLGPDSDLGIAPARPNAVIRIGLWVKNVVSRVAFAGLHLGALLTLFLVTPTWTALGLMLVMFAVRTFGLTAGYHRYFAHRGYSATRWFQFVLGWLGAMALQRGPMWWASHHRVHHKYSDQEGDPHSPIVKSIWWSHVGWVISDDRKDAEWHLMKDWNKYPELMWIDRFDWLPGVLGALFCYLVGLAVDGAGVPALLWGFVVSTVMLYHTTFMVNSVCHLLGRRRFETGDRSRNNWFVALVTFGEGWHNNHHHYPSSARQGFRWYEIDISYSVLVVLSWFGIVWNLRQPTPRALAKNRIAP